MFLKRCFASSHCKSMLRSSARTKRLLITTFMPTLAVYGSFCGVGVCVWEQTVFNLFVSQLQHLSKPESSNFKRYYYLLEVFFVCLGLGLWALFGWQLGYRAAAFVSVLR